MKLLRPMTFDLCVRGVGAALLLVATALLAALPARGGSMAQPSTAEFFVVLVAICAGSVGASFIVVGAPLFQSADPTSGRAAADRGVARDD